MAHIIGNCGHCNESCDLDDPDHIVVTGSTGHVRIHKVFCTFDCLAQWAAAAYTTEES